MAKANERTLERLDELLTLREEALEKAESRISELESQINFGIDWMYQRRGENEHPRLPVPRIQMSVVANEMHYQESEACIVLAQRDGTVTYVPLSYSKRTGGTHNPDDFPTTGEMPDHLAARLPSAFQDACFYGDKAGLPIFVIIAEDKQYQVTSLRPGLKLLAV